MGGGALGLQQVLAGRRKEPILLSASSQSLRAHHVRRCGTEDTEFVKKIKLFVEDAEDAEDVTPGGSEIFAIFVCL